MVDGLGSAVIKGGSREQVYAVGDDLPVSGKVTLVKVMPRQVVIDNSGTYELIKLYEGPGLVLPTRAAQRARPDLVTPATSQSGGDDTVVDVVHPHLYRRGVIGQIWAKKVLL